MAVMSHNDENGKTKSKSEASSSVHLTPRTSDGHAPTTSKELQVVRRSRMRCSTIKYTCSRFGGGIKYNLSRSYREFRTRWMECRSNGSHLASAKGPTPSGRRSL